jgi:dipeptidyl aminopeptidase/acylaminoacyl peptidase
MQISQPPEYAINPVWSPSGAEILFGGISRNSYQAHIVSSDGQNSRLLIPNASDPRWSPDGRRIVFETDRTNPKRRRLSIMELATNAIQDIPHSEGFASPRWSPDGRYIVALAVVPPPRLFNVKTQQWTLMPLVGDINFPAWSRDSRYIYGLDLDSVSGDRWIFRIPVPDGAPERVLSLNDWKLTGWCGFSLSLDPLDAPLLLRETGSSEIYALTLDRE